jgi:multiple sugar transport system substrate-binding protein
MAEPEILTPFLQEYGYLPTQKMVGYGQLFEPLNDTVPFFEEMISMIPYGRSRPNIPEYPQIAEHITQAIQQVYNGSALPEEALDIAAKRSADSLGWDTTQ